MEWQSKPADLDEAETQACLAQVGVAFKRLGTPKQGQRLVSVTVTNRSRYDFRGKVLLNSFASDGEETGRAEVDLTQGPALRTGRSATYEVVFHTPRWVADITGSAEGKLYRVGAHIMPDSGKQ